ncbi:META domain-containing protein [Pseudomonas panipatensis]|uniref:META domain-containing protein n=1 Tax=Pseudomonas panipatensis TaxID=428992 RepID=UPI0035B04E48
MKPLLALGLGALLLAGCANHAAQPESGQTYRVEWIGERPLMDRSYLTLTLDGQGRAYGSAGCNHWFASYQLDGDKLSFGHAGSTMKACAPALMEQEQRFLKALGDVQRWEITDQGQLRLWPATGRSIRLWPES